MKHIIRMPAIIILLFMTTVTMSNYAQQYKKDNPGDLTSVYDYINTHLHNTGKEYDSLITLVINLADFYCHACLMDILGFLDELGSVSQRQNNKTLVIVKKNDYQKEEIQKRIVERWANVHRIKFPVIIDDNIFKMFEIEKTSIVLFENNGKIYYHESFPLGEDKRNEIIEYLK